MPHHLEWLVVLVPIFKLKVFVGKVDWIDVDFFERHIVFKLNVLRVIL